MKKEVGKRSSDAVVKHGRDLADTFATYLHEHGDFWHHVAEFDSDTIPGLGPDFASEQQHRLRRIVGDRLMPVYHDMLSGRSWVEMIRTFPYVAIGSEAVDHADVNDRIVTPRTRLLACRSRIDQAHRSGASVHVMGMMREDHLDLLRPDSVDATTWMNSIKYGKITTMKTTFSRSHRAESIDTVLPPKSRRVLERRGLDPESVVYGGATAVQRSKASVWILLDRQEGLRQNWQR